MGGYSLLRGVRVLEVAKLAPSSVGGQLADLGADVIKVETGPGDGVRNSGAHAIGSVDGPGFLHTRWNRGKQSITLDLGDEHGKEVFRRLARDSDVVIEGTRTGYLDWLDLGPDVLRQENPSLVFCSVSGYGSGGPYEAMGSGGPVFDAYGGLRQVDLGPQPPTSGVAGSSHPNIAMYAIGAYGAMAVLAALINARSTGEGKDIELAGADIAVTWTPDEIDSVLNREKLTPRPGWLPDGRLAVWPRTEAYSTKDGSAILLVAYMDKFWRNLCRAVDREDLLTIDLQTEDDGLIDRANYLWGELRTIFLQRTKAEWIELFLANDIAGGPLNEPDEVPQDQHFRARNNTYTTTINGVDVELLASPVRVKGETFSPDPAPGLGTDTQRVLDSLLDTELNR